MTLADDVELLRRTIRDSEDLDPVLQRFCAEHGEAAVRPLFAVFPFEEEDDNHHYMYSLIHTIESYGNDTYMRALIEEAPRIVSDAPLLGTWLLGRICSSDSHSDTFLELIRPRPLATKQAVASLFRFVAVRFAKKRAIVNRANDAVQQLTKS